MCWPGDDARQVFFDNYPNKKWPRDTDRIDSEVLESLYEKWVTATEAGKEAAELETAIVKILDAKGVGKVRFKDGTIYRVKQLKSGLVLRRGKL